MTDLKDATNDGCWSVSDDGGSEEKNGNSGRWTKEEHDTFVLGLGLYGRDWKKVATAIKTRTPSQIRSHAQKYFQKLSRSPIVNDSQPSLLGEDDQDAFTVLEYLETTLKSLKRKRDELDCAGSKSPMATNRTENIYKNRDNQDQDNSELIENGSSRQSESFKQNISVKKSNIPTIASNLKIKSNNSHHNDSKSVQLMQERNGNLKLSRLHEEELIAVQVLCGTRNTSSMECFNDTYNNRSDSSGHTSNAEDSDNRSGHSSNNESEEEGTSTKPRHRNCNSENETESETTGSSSSE